MASEKAWNRDKPFARLSSPSFDPSRPRASGRGFERGAHSTKFGPTVFGDGPFDTLSGDLLRGIPNWVSVELQDRVEELEGKLERSFQTWTDNPPFQWHRWYDWNFHIEPDPGYAFLRGLGNHDAPSDPFDREDQENERARRGVRPVTSPASMECEWDAGAFGTAPGVMFGGRVPWPMTGQRVWMAGRWIYDCGHSSNDDVPEGPNQGLMRTELHPVKALAFAWWEAERFEENGELFVPALKLMFFMSRLGGYHEFPAINDGDANGNDYEFIVDLPELATAESRYAIGHTPTFALNTVALRHKRVHKFDFDAFTEARGTQGRIDPIIEDIVPDDPTETKRQVKIKFPTTQLPAGADYYGVIVSLGWWDPDGSQARKVKRCVVTLRNLLKGSIDHDTFAEEWLFKACVNGRWFQWMFEGVRNNRELDLGDQQVELFLHEDESIQFSTHGADLDATHDAMGVGPLRIGGSRAHWVPDIDSFNASLVGVPHSRNRPDYVQARRVVDALTSLFMGEFGIIGAIAVGTDENDPLGIIDPGLGPADERRFNPLSLQGNEQLDLNVSLRAFEVGADPHSAELEEKTRGSPDYTLRLHVKVERQNVPGGGG